MLQLLNISNIALIDDMQVEFESGLNLLTGETGSGKSIIVDALGVRVLAEIEKARLLWQPGCLSHASQSSPFQFNEMVLQIDVAIARRQPPGCQGSSRAASHARIPSTTEPCTSVSRKSRP